MPNVATVANLPTVSSCYYVAILSATTLTSQAVAACTNPSYFCQVTNIMKILLKEILRLGWVEKGREIKQKEAIFGLYYIKNAAKIILKKATFTGVSGNSASSVSQGCASTQCTPSSTVMCSMTDNTNQVLGCYVGFNYEIGLVSTFEKQICAPIAYGTTYVTAAYCMVY
jgi:hypothetical protein